FHASAVELEAEALARLCARFEFADSGARVLIQEDLWRHPEFARDSLVAERPGFRFMAAVPLRSPDGLIVGLFCVLDAASRTFSNADVELLLSIGDSARQELELRRSGAESDRLLRE